ncbi:MAG TPA: SUMF1/EgtB/PvdO family nonheme iron enzyme, partial [Bacteroidia bacterium]|nr:SUMF1/EgtB/PvdO family nonheme iron enzyme [Bacteroidia bacterium]
MKTGTEHTEPVGFDQLLSLALLERNELFNETNNEIMAHNILSLPGEFPAAENKQVLEKLISAFATRGKKYRWWMNLVILSALVTSVVLVAGIYGGTKTETVLAQSILPQQPNEPVEQLILAAGKQPEEKTMKRDENIVLPIATDSAHEVNETPVTPELPAQFSKGHTFFRIPEPFEEEAEVPVLSEAEKKKNNKRKLEMLRDIVKRKSFVNVLSGPAWRNGERFQVNQFSMQNSEVSNWQYTVFLNDLLMDGRNDDYTAAKPVNGNWKAVGIPEFENNYASDKGFEKFPVLNISRSAAEMYCTWLTKEMGEAIDQKDVKWNNATRPEFRLPSDIEWLRAARGNDSTLQFPWGATVNALQNSHGCYLCNFNYSISKPALGTEGPIASKGSRGCISPKPNTRNVITTAGRSIDTLVLAPEYAYNPAVFGHYLLMGNAAEMVWTYDRDAKVVGGAARAMGGSWYSHADEVRIESKQQFEGITEANVCIGFRCVMVV